MTYTKDELRDTAEALDRLMRDVVPMLRQAAEDREALAAKDAEIARLSSSMPFDALLASLKTEIKRLTSERDCDSLLCPYQSDVAHLTSAIWGDEAPHEIHETVALIKAHRSDSDAVDQFESSKDAAEAALAAERAKVRELREWLSRNEGNGKRTADELLLLLVVRGKLDALGLTGEEPR